MSEWLVVTITYLLGVLTTPLGFLLWLAIVWHLEDLEYRRHQRRLAQRADEERLPQSANAVSPQPANEAAEEHQQQEKPEAGNE
jgi:hypothetical protein